MDHEQQAGKRLVFISHSSRDRWVARQLARAVQDRGAQTFLDAAVIEAGDTFSDEIRGALSEADELVVLWTPVALERPFVWLEVGGAWLRQIPIIQVLYGLTVAELQVRPGFPAFLTTLEMVNLDDIDSYLEQLEDRCRSAE